MPTGDGPTGDSTGSARKPNRLALAWGTGPGTIDRSARSRRARNAGLSADTPYSADALRSNACIRHAFGGPFIDYFIKLKEFEIDRFLSDVTDWEQRGYFAIL